MLHTIFVRSYYRFLTCVHLVL